MSNRKYVLPEGRIALEFNPANWSLVEKGILNEIQISGVVDLNTGTKAEINLVIEHSVYAPFSVENKIEDIATKEMGIGPQNFTRACSFRVFLQMAMFFFGGEDNWFLFGSVVSKGHKTPILIVYSKIAKRGFYSMKRKTDIMEGTFDPSMN